MDWQYRVSSIREVVVRHRTFGRVALGDLCLHGSGKEQPSTQAPKSQIAGKLKCPSSRGKVIPKDDFVHEMEWENVCFRTLIMFFRPSQFQ